MDHNGLYPDLDSFASITSCNATSSSFGDTLPSINNFKYQQPTNLSANIYQQSNHESQPKTSQTLPQTQININNCNNNIFFPHDDVLFDASTAPTCASSTNNQSQKNNFIGHVQKELETTGGVGRRDNTNPLKNVYFNINNINTNIVNNIQNPTNFANSTDVFSGNQYHQINKNGETIINFTNNNLNSAGGSSMPADTVSATSQNYYGYQSNNSSSQGQQTVYETSVQSQTQSQSSDFLDPSLSATKQSMSGMTGHYHSHHLNQNPLNQTMTNGSFLPGTNSISSEHSATTLDPFSEFPETLSTAKIINNFESKNPLKYQTSSRPNGAYYKSATEFPSHQYGHLPPHNYPGLYPTTKIPTSHSYEAYQRIPRSNTLHYPTQHYAAPTIDEHNASRLSYNRPTAVPVHNPYPHHPHSLPPHPSNSYANYYSNGYGHYPGYPQPPGPPYGNPMIRNESCSKPSTNYNKTSAIALSPVEHGSYALPHATYSTPKKDFYSENPYYPPPPHAYYEDPMNNSCAKKASSRPKVSNDIYNPNGATLYPDHHSMSHHQQSVRNVGFQPMPKHYSGGGNQPAYSMPTNSCDLTNPYHNFSYQHPKMQKMNPALSSKQFKSYGHFEPMPHPHGHYPHPQYHTMQAKHPEKIKISIDLEEQINSSKIPKINGYGYEPHPQLYYQYHHHMPPRNPIIDNDTKNSIANINLRDFLSTWNEIDEEDETGERRAATNGALEDLNEHVERTIMREYNPMFVQKVTDSFMSAADLPSNKSQLSELDSVKMSEGSEKLYVLESIDVPLSELNKYKHLSVINKLPENVVINDSEDSSMKFIEEIDLTKEKLYKSEFELEFEACQERKSIDETVKPQKVLPVVEKPNEEVAKKSDSEEKTKKRKKSVKVKATKLKSDETRIPKIKQSLLKLKKEKILKASSSKDPRKARITKRGKKYSLNQRTSSVRSLQSTCVDILNTSTYRNYAREQISIINKQSKMKILQDFKKKFNFDGMKRANAAVSQKLNRSEKMNSLRQICGELLKDKSRILESNDSEDVPSENCGDEEEFPSLLELSRKVLSDMDIDVVENDYLYSPASLKELCESFIYTHNQYFLIEEVSSVPKLQDLCKNVLSETNIFINIDEENEGIFTINDDDETEAIQSSEIVGEDIYIVEENSGNVGELFESEQLNSFERSEILRKIQRVANIEDDDEIIRAIGALHRDEDVESIINNNNSDVTNRNFSESNEFSTTNEESKFDSEMSFLSFMDDDLMHSVQYEEIISINDRGDKATKKIVEILRFKHLNRSDVKQATKTIRAILKKSLTYQRSHRFRNAKRRRQIEALKRQARAALWKLKKLRNCDNILDESTSEHSFIKAVSPINQRESENESQYDAKDDTKAQSPHEIVFNHFDPTSFINDSPPDDCFDVQAELNFPKLPAMFPSINEYKLDRKSSNRSDVEDIYDAKRRRLTFDESLLSIEKQEVRKGSQSSSRNRQHRHHSTSRHHHNSAKSHESSRSYHKHSSRHNNYKPRDQMKHSEAKRLVIPSYKLYDKDLDLKLKSMPFVRIEREEKVDDMLKQYN